MKAIGWLACASVIFVQVCAHAQGDSADVAMKRERAAAQLKKGVALVRLKRPDDARAYFAEVLALFPTPGVLMNLALAEYESKHYPEALGHFREWMATAGPAEKPLVPEAKEYVAKLSALTGHVRVEGAEEGAVVVDGGPVEKTVHEGNVYDVVPGHHQIVATVAGAPQSRGVYVDAGATVTMRFEPRVSSTNEDFVPVKVEPGTSVPREIPGKPVWPEARATVWPPPLHSIVLGAAGVAALGVGIGFAVDVGAKNDQITNKAKYVCGPGANAADCGAMRDVLSARNDSQGLRNTFLGIGGAAVGAAIVTWVLFPRQTKRERQAGFVAVPSVGPGTARLDLSGTF